MSYEICQQIKADGVQCQSPAVKDKVFCYYHLRTYDTKSYAGEHGYWPPPLENHQAIQVTIFHILRGLSNGSLHRKDAYLMMVGAQLALKTLPATVEPPPEKIVTEMNDTMRAVLGSMEPMRFTAKELQYVWLENARQQGWNGGKVEAKPPKNPDEEA